MYKHLFAVLFICFALCNLSNTAIAAKQIFHPKVRLPQDRYMSELLQIAISYKPGKYQLQEVDQVLTRARLKEMVSSGDMSVMWTGSSKATDRVLRPIHIPAYKGLMGHRVFIIRRGDQARFDAVNSLDELRRIKLGQGKSWSDTTILRNAGFNVVTSVKFDGLFYMLDGERFDAFPRGVQEPWMEVTSRSDLNLTVEKHLVLKYTMPYYFYVATDNMALARDLKEGLEAAIADGTFDEHFYNDAEVKLALEKSDLKNRKIFSIDNPNISQDIPVDNPELWLDLSK